MEKLDSPQLDQKLNVEWILLASLWLLWEPQKLLFFHWICGSNFSHLLLNWLSGRKTNRKHFLWGQYSNSHIYFQLFLNKKTQNSFQEIGFLLVIFGIQLNLLFCFSLNNFCFYKGQKLLALIKVSWWDFSTIIRHGWSLFLLNYGTKKCELLEWRKAKYYGGEGISDKISSCLWGKGRGKALV